MGEKKEVLSVTQPLQPINRQWSLDEKKQWVPSMSEDVLVASNRLIQENDQLQLRGVLGRPWELLSRPNKKTIT